MQLGSIIFRDLEVEAGVDFGGRQRLAVHRLPNGDRIIDVLGPDAANIIFGGVFTGSDAVTRAQALDALRKSGQQVTLTWNTFQYGVILSDFSADFENRNWIPYRATCTVVEDDTPTVESDELSLDEAALASASALVATGFLPGCTVNPAATPNRQTVSEVGSNSDLRADLATRIAQCEVALAAVEARLELDPAAALSQAEEILEQLAVLVTASSYVAVGTINAGSTLNG